MRSNDSVLTQRRPRWERRSLRVDVDGSDITTTKMCEMMLTEARASIAAWHAAQRERKQTEHEQRHRKRIANATISQINKSVRKHSRHALSERNKKRITDMQSNWRAATRARQQELEHIHSKRVAKHKAPYCRPRPTHHIIDSVPTVAAEATKKEIATALAAMAAGQHANRALVDGGASMLVTANRNLFIEATLRPTTQKIRGLDRKLHTADAIGYAQLHFMDKNGGTIWRLTVEGILVEKVLPNAFTLISVPQLNIDGISLNQPCKPDDPCLYVGALNDPTHCATLDTASDLLLHVDLMDSSEVARHIKRGAILQDLTSMPADVIKGHTRTIQGFDSTITLCPAMVPVDHDTPSTDEITDTNTDQSTDQSSFKSETSEHYESRLKNALTLHKHP